MGHPIRKDGRLLIPDRDKTQIARAKPCYSDSSSEAEQHKDQVAKAGTLAFIRYERAFEKLSKV